MAELDLSELPDRTPVAKEFLYFEEFEDDIRPSLIRLETSFGFYFMEIPSGVPRRLFPRK
jgi:hypothetical protein